MSPPSTKPENAGADRRSTVATSDSGSGAHSRAADGDPIVTRTKPSVKAVAEKTTNGSKPGRGRPRKTRRQSHGSTWHWKQTDCWYYTLAGTKLRVALFDEDGNRIRGVENKQAAQLALARVKLGGKWQPTAEQPAQPQEWLVARVCSEYIQ